MSDHKLKAALDAPRKPGEPLRTARQELYAQKIAAGIPRIQAFRELYPNSNEKGLQDRKGLVEARIRELQIESAAKVTSSVRHTREEIIRVLWKNIDRGAQAEPVYDKKGAQLTDELPCKACGVLNAANVYRFDGQVVNKGIELAMKELGLGIERKETHVVHSRELANLSHGEIHQLLQDTARQYGYRLIKTEEYREPDSGEPPQTLQ